MILIRTWSPPATPHLSSLPLPGHTSIFFKAWIRTDWKITSCNLHLKWFQVLSQSSWNFPSSLSDLCNCQHTTLPSLLLPGCSAKDHNSLVWPNETAHHLLLYLALQTVSRASPLRPYLALRVSTCFHFHPTLKRGKEKEHAIVYKYEPAVKHMIYYIHLKRVQDSTFYWSISF